MTSSQGMRRRLLTATGEIWLPLQLVLRRGVHNLRCSYGAVRIAIHICHLRSSLAAAWRCMRARFASLRGCGVTRAGSAQVRNTAQSRGKVSLCQATGHARGVEESQPAVPARQEYYPEQGN